MNHAAEDVTNGLFDRFFDLSVNISIGVKNVLVVNTAVLASALFV